MRAFTRAELHIDAIKQENYNQFAKSSFSRGKVKTFHQQLNQLSESLQEKESNVDQHTLHINQLIKNLDSPILVFNHKQQLIYANNAFSNLYQQSWQMYRHASPEQLALSFDGSTWHSRFSDQKWQIKHCQTNENEHGYQLLMFIDISLAVQTGQLHAWQKIIHVLSNEVRNSLTPVSSLSETLASKSLIENDKTALEIITERSHYLQTYVDRYSMLFPINEILRQDVSLQALSDSLSHACQNLTILFDFSIQTIYVDLSLFEQVFLNLLNNSQEAEARNVQVNFSEHEQHLIIEVIDDGHGFDNLDNLFIPLYSTKLNGQGVGLSFCKNVIEQHQGVIEIHNNEEKGATIMIILPLHLAVN